MDNMRSPSVIKLFFEVDDRKASLNVEDILNTNEELAKKVKQLEATNSGQNLEIQESRIKIQQLSDAIKIHERNKRTDDMALSAYKALKQETMIHSTKLEEEVKYLKLDLLAERELRRIHQSKLREFDPQNDNYNPAAAEVTVEATPATGSRWQSKTAVDMSVECKPIDVASDPAAECSSPEIPRKLVRSILMPTVPNFIDKASLSGSRQSLGHNPQQGMKIVVKSPRPIPVSKRGTTAQTILRSLFAPEASTSAPAFSFSAPSVPNIRFANGKPISFGGSPAFPAPLASPSAGASTSNNMFQSPGSLLSFAPSSQATNTQPTASQPISGSPNVFRTVPATDPSSSQNKSIFATKASDR